MMEEVAKTTQKGQKERFISQIVTPHHPTYLFGAVDKKGVTAQDTVESRPIVGVACSVSGFKVNYEGSPLLELLQGGCNGLAVS